MSRPPWPYRLALRLAAAAAPAAGRFDPKIARGITARAGLADRLAAWAAAHRDAERPLVWFHAPSVGEGLQAKPVVEALRAERPRWQIAYTFFSPSAERFAHTLSADVTDYLPFDRPGDVAAALAALRPTALVYSKLDVWPELTLAAHRAGVRTGLVSATVAATSGRLRWPVRSWAARAYGVLQRVGAISPDDAGRLETLGVRPEAILVTGDTRYDSVVERAARLDRMAEPLARLAIFPAGTFTIVAGSTWPADEAIVLAAFAALRAQVPAARLVLAPHEPHPDHLAAIAQRARTLGLARPVRLSQLEPATDAPLILVDRVGVLADLYGVADAAFVGGGYHRAGLHSVLEPAVFGAPVAFGPRWHGSRDAALLIERGGAVALPADGVNALLGQLLVWHHDPRARAHAGDAGRALVATGRGAAARTAALVRELVEGGGENA